MHMPCYKYKLYTILVVHIQGSQLQSGDHTCLQIQAAIVDYAISLTMVMQRVTYRLSSKDITCKETRRDAKKGCASLSLVPY